MTQQSLLYSNREKEMARDCASPGRIIKVGAFLPGQTAKCIEHAASSGLLSQQCTLVCFENGKQGNFNRMRNAVMSKLNKYRIYATVHFSEYNLEDDICECAKHYNLIFDYVFADFCGFATKKLLRAVSQWNPRYFSSDCIISATFKASGQGQRCISDLADAADKAHVFGARHNPVSGKATGKAEVLSLAQQTAFCHALPFANFIRNSFSYRHMMVFKTAREKGNKPLLRSMPEISSTINSTGDAVEHWADSYGISLTRGEKAGLTRQLREKRPIQLRNVRLTAGQKMSLRKLGKK